MPKKVVLLFLLLVVAASFLGYKLGSAPVALAKGRPTPQEASDQIAPPLPAPPAEWVVYNVGSVSPAKATRGAVAGVQHVADCVSVTTSNQGTATGGGSVLLLDGSNIIMEWILVSPSFSSGGEGHISLCGLSVVGSVDQSMTLEFSGVASGAVQTVNLVGHDAT